MRPIAPYNLTLQDAPMLNYNDKGFTLIELLTVVAILAAVAAIGVQSLIGVDNQTEERLVLTEMQRIASAVSQFKHDTGFWPRTGNFARTAQGGQVSNTVNEERFRSPANFSQLYELPINAAGDAVMPYNPQTGRGWNGPYLSIALEGAVSIGDDCRFDGANAGGSDICFPDNGDVINDILAVADPFTATPNGDYFIWRSPVSSTFLNRGRPYLLFTEAGAELNVEGCFTPCLVSFGPDNIYEGGDGDDIVLNF